MKHHILFMTNTTVDQKAIDQMFKAGTHLGYSRARRHPSMREFIFGAKNRVEIIDLEKSLPLLDAAKNCAREITLAGGNILFVGTKPEAHAILLEGALSVGAPYVTERWIGGIITNFSEIKKRIARLKELMMKRDLGTLSMYTKKERLLIDREITDLTKNFGGVVSLEGAPKALFVIDPRHEHNAIREAKKQHIPIIALASTDCNIKGITYPIPANDVSAESIKFIVSEIVTAIKDARRARTLVEAEAEAVLVTPLTAQQ